MSRSLVTSAMNDENRAVNFRNICQSIQSPAASSNYSPLMNDKGQYSRQSYEPIPITPHPFSLTTNYPHHSNSLNFTSTITPYSSTQTRTTSVHTADTTHSLAFNHNYPHNSTPLNFTPYNHFMFFNCGINSINTR